MKKRTTTYLTTALLCLTCGLGAYIIPQIIYEPATRVWFHPAFLSAWLRVGQAMRITSAHYVDPAAVTPEKLASRALASLPADLDPYSEYLPPKAYDDFQQQTNQTYLGIGVTLQLLDGRPTIIRILPGSAAAESGLEPGDSLTHADDAPLEPLDLATASNRIKGPAGTAVSLRLLRPGHAAPLTRSVVRRKTTLPTLADKRLLPQHTAYLRVTQFESRTAEEISAALAELTQAGAQRLVLDLRDNPGGLVSAAVDTVALFCPPNTTVTTASSRHSTSDRAYRTAAATVSFQQIPIAILVNRDTASASEIVSGALQDHKRALIVGDRTHGKGVVQTIYPLDATDGLKITTARYLLPSGRSIQGAGVQPDIFQPMDRRTRILQTLADTWRDLGREGEYTRRYGRPPPEDTQLNAALDALNALANQRPAK
ncbi:MAG: S41 family peptidase [Puniceicoccales bacterium]|jgi:carboxyl-terminal processing protease|nr:S41 family peptidase [Puniceicoccales bacterium]